MDDYYTQASVEQYRLLAARETGLEFGRGSCAAVVEVDYKGLRCAGKKIHRVLYEGQVDNLINEAFRGRMQVAEPTSTPAHSPVPGHLLS